MYVLKKLLGIMMMGIAAAIVFGCVALEVGWQIAAAAFVFSLVLTGLVVGDISLLVD